MRSLAMSIFLYACETWTFAAEIQSRVQAMEMSCYRKILCISYKDHVTNEKIHNRIEQAIGLCEDFLTTVKRRKLKCARLTNIPPEKKNILLGNIMGARRIYRKRWEDNIGEWTIFFYMHTRHGLLQPNYKEEYKPCT